MFPRFAVAQQEPPGFTGAAASDEPVVQSEQATSTEQAVTDGTATSTTTSINWDSEDNPYRRQYTGLQGNFKQVHQQFKQTQQELDATRLRLAELEGAAQGMSKDEIDQQAKLVKAVEMLTGERTELLALRQELMPSAKQRALEILAKEHGITAADLEEAESIEVAQALAKILGKRTRSDKVQERVTNNIDRAESGGGGVLNDAQFLAAYNRGDNDDHARARKILTKLT